jgi:hypothetical protein
VLSKISREIDALDTGILFAEGFDCRPGIVRAGIVDEYKLEISEHRLHAFLNTLIEFPKKNASHVYGNDNRKLVITCHSVGDRECWGQECWGQGKRVCGCGGVRMQGTVKE